MQEVQMGTALCVWARNKADFSAAVMALSIDLIYQHLA